MASILPPYLFVPVVAVVVVVTVFPVLNMVPVVTVLPEVIVINVVTHVSVVSVVPVFTLSLLPLLSLLSLLTLFSQLSLLSLLSRLSHPRRPRGSQSGREKMRDESFQVRAEEPLGTDSHRTISKNSSGCRLLIGHKKCFVLLCPMGEQFLLSSFREFVHNGYYLATLARFVQQACACKGNVYFLLFQQETKELPMSRRSVWDAISRSN